MPGRMKVTLISDTRAVNFVSPAPRRQPNSTTCYLEEEGNAEYAHYLFTIVEYDLLLREQSKYLLAKQKVYRSHKAGAEQSYLLAHVSVYLRHIRTLPAKALTY